MALFVDFPAVVVVVAVSAVTHRDVCFDLRDLMSGRRRRYGLTKGWKEKKQKLS
jgi:hypothetical protein